MPSFLYDTFFLPLKIGIRLEMLFTFPYIYKHIGHLK
jgi:hypothetical protein